MLFEDIEDDDFGLKMPNVLTLTVSVAVTRLLETIDGSRALFTSASASQAGAKAKSPLLDKLRKNLTHDQRREVEQAVKALRDVRGRRIEDAIQAAIAEVRDKLSVTVNSTTVYPPSPEQQMAGYQLVTRKVGREIYEEFLKPFENSLDQMEYATALLNIGDSDFDTELLGKALLPLQVSALEEFIAALLRTALTKYPNGLGTLSNVPFDVIDKYGKNVSTEDLKRWAIDRQVESFLRQTPGEWRERLKNWSRIDIADLGAGWDTIEEAIQRRHAIIHKGGIADGDYIAKVPERLRPGVFIGMPLECDRTYLDYLLIELETLGICVGLRWASHFFKAEPTAFIPFISARLVSMQDERRWAKVAAICDSALFASRNATKALAVFKLTLWYCRQEMGLEDSASRQEILEFGPANEIEDIAKAALLSDRERMVDGIRALNDHKHKVTIRRHLRESSVIQREMAKYPEVRAALSNVGRSHSPMSSNRKKSRGRKPRR